MTEAQKAHIRLLEQTPRERIHTHEQPPEGQKGVRPSPDVTARRRLWIKANLGNMSKKKMAEELNISIGSIHRHFKALGIKPNKKGRPRKHG